MTLGLAATNRRLSQLGQWWLFDDYGVTARRYAISAWACVAVLGFTDTIWLPMSGLAFDTATWPSLVSFVSYAAIAYIFYLVVSHRLRCRHDRIAALLRRALERLGLLFRGGVIVSAIGSVGLIFSYLVTAAAFPLKDGLLANFDQRLGFHWLAFLSATNDHPLLAFLLKKAYASTAGLTEGVLLWLAFSVRGERLAEFLALLCLTSVGLAIGMVLIPAAGANVFFVPPPQLFDNFTTDGKLWDFLDAFHGLRNGSLKTIDMSAIQGVVSFPSFHTILGVITAYALRDTKALFVPAILLNGTMIVATLPVGGHYLADVMAGAVVCFASIRVLRVMSRGYEQRVVGYEISGTS
jgi:hypothetical protein